MQYVINFHSKYLWCSFLFLILGFTSQSFARSQSEKKLELKDLSYTQKRYDDVNEKKKNFKNTLANKSHFSGRSIASIPSDGEIVSEAVSNSDEYNGSQAKNMLLTMNPYKPSLLKNPKHRKYNISNAQFDRQETYSELYPNVHMAGSYTEYRNGAVVPYNNGFAPREGYMGIVIGH